MNTQESLDHLELLPTILNQKETKVSKTSTQSIHLNIIYQEHVFDDQGTIHKASFDHKLKVLSSRIIEKRREEEYMIKRSSGG